MIPQSQMEGEAVTPIQLQITIISDENTLSALVEIIRRVRIASQEFDGQREARIRASQHANLKGQKIPDDKGLLIDIKATAELLDVSERTVWGLANSGRMPKPIKIGRLVRWGHEELRAWVAEGCPALSDWKWPRQ